MEKNDFFALCDIISRRISWIIWSAKRRIVYVRQVQRILRFLRENYFFARKWQINLSNWKVYFTFAASNFQNSICYEEKLFVSPLLSMDWIGDCCHFLCGSMRWSKYGFFHSGQPFIMAIFPLTKNPIAVSSAWLILACSPLPCLCWSSAWFS